MATALITGANRGLGLEFVRQYAADGWDVIAACRQPEKATQLLMLAKENKKIRIETLDIAELNSITALAQKHQSTPIDLLINNAGIFSGTGRDGRNFLEDADDASQRFGSIDPVAWNKVLQINTIAPIMVIQTLLPNVRQSKGQKIVVISSQMGSIERTTRSGDIAYRTSKAGLNAAIKNLAIALEDQVAIACLHPGWVKTDMGGSRANLTPTESITGLRKVITGLTLQDSGKFFSYDGQIIPW